MTLSRFPTYAELRENASPALPTSWDVFGKGDELGTLNHLTPARVREATSEVRAGDVFNLDLALDAFVPPLISSRKQLEHKIFAGNEFHRDEYVDSLYTQSGSQIDGFRHIGHPEVGFYQGADPESFKPGTPHLGINRFADHGIAGRGVLVDVDRYRREVGRPIDHAGAEAITASDLVAAAAAQGVTFVPGDILLLRTGWVRYHLEELDDVGRRESVISFRASGLEASHETVAWLWDNQFSMVATDNFAVEAWPARAGSPFVTEGERGGLIPFTSHTGLMHRVLIPLLGMVLGELWNLDALAQHCADDGRWTSMVIANPLNLVGSAGSPANAIAIR